MTSGVTRVLVKLNTNEYCHPTTQTNKCSSGIYSRLLRPIEYHVTGSTVAGPERRRRTRQDVRVGDNRKYRHVTGATAANTRPDARAEDDRSTVPSPARAGNEHSARPLPVGDTGNAVTSVIRTVPRRSLSTRSRSGIKLACWTIGVCAIEHRMTGRYYS